MVLRLINDMRAAAFIACTLGVGPASHKSPLVKYEATEDATRVIAYGDNHRHELIMHDGGKTVLKEDQLFTNGGAVTTTYPDGRIERWFGFVSAASCGHTVKYGPLPLDYPAFTRRQLRWMASEILPVLSQLKL